MCVHLCVFSFIQLVENMYIYVIVRAPVLCYDVIYHRHQFCTQEW